MARRQVQELLGQMQKTLECSICLDMMTSPVSTACCHQFCRFCLMEFLERKKQVPCPLCKKPITKRSLMERPHLADIVDGVRKLITAFQKDTGVLFSLPRGPQAAMLPSTPECVQKNTRASSRKTNVQHNNKDLHPEVELVSSESPERHEENEDCVSLYSSETSLKVLISHKDIDDERRQTELLKCIEDGVHRHRNNVPLLGNMTEDSSVDNSAENIHKSSSKKCMTKMHVANKSTKIPKTESKVHNTDLKELKENAYKFINDSKIDHTFDTAEASLSQNLSLISQESECLTGPLFKTPLEVQKGTKRSKCKSLEVSTTVVPTYPKRSLRSRSNNEVEDEHEGTAFMCSLVSSGIQEDFEILHNKGVYKTYSKKDQATFKDEKRVTKKVEDWLINVSEQEILTYSSNGEGHGKKIAPKRKKLSKRNIKLVLDEKIMGQKIKNFAKQAHDRKLQFWNKDLENFDQTVSITNCKKHVTKSAISELQHESFGFQWIENMATEQDVPVKSKTTQDGIHLCVTPSQENKNQVSLPNQSGEEIGKDACVLSSLQCLTPKPVKQGHNETAVTLDVVKASEAKSKIRNSPCRRKRIFKSRNNAVVETRPIPMKSLKQIAEASIKCSESSLQVLAADKKVRNCEDKSEVKQAFSMTEKLSVNDILPKLDLYEFKSSQPTPKKVVRKKKRKQRNNMKLEFKDGMKREYNNKNRHLPIQDDLLTLKQFKVPLKKTLKACKADACCVKEIEKFIADTSAAEDYDLVTCTQEAVNNLLKQVKNCTTENHNQNGVVRKKVRFQEPESSNVIQRAHTDLVCVQKAEQQFIENSAEKEKTAVTADTHSNTKGDLRTEDISIKQSDEATSCVQDTVEFGSSIQRSNNMAKSEIGEEKIAEESDDLSEDWHFPGDSSETEDLDIEPGANEFEPPNLDIQPENIKAKLEMIYTKKTSADLIDFVQETPVILNIPKFNKDFVNPVKFKKKYTTSHMKSESKEKDSMEVDAAKEDNKVAILEAHVNEIKEITDRVQIVPETPLIQAASSGLDEQNNSSLTVTSLNIETIKNCENKVLNMDNDETQSPDSEMEVSTLKAFIPISNAEKISLSDSIDNDVQQSYETDKNVENVLLQSSESMLVKKQFHIAPQENLKGLKSNEKMLDLSVTNCSEDTVEHYATEMVKNNTVETVINYTRKTFKRCTEATVKDDIDEPSEKCSEETFLKSVKDTVDLPIYDFKNINPPKKKRKCFMLDDNKGSLDLHCLGEAAGSDAINNEVNAVHPKRQKYGRLKRSPEGQREKSECLLLDESDSRFHNSSDRIVVCSDAKDKVEMETDIFESIDILPNTKNTPRYSGVEKSHKEDINMCTYSDISYLKLESSIGTPFEKSSGDTQHNYSSNISEEITIDSHFNKSTLNLDYTNLTDLICATTGTNNKDNRNTGDIVELVSYENQVMNAANQNSAESVTNKELGNTADLELYIDNVDDITEHLNNAQAEVVDNLIGESEMIEGSGKLSSEFTATIISNILTQKQNGESNKEIVKIKMPPANSSEETESSRHLSGMLVSPVELTSLPNLGEGSQSAIVTIHSEMPAIDSSPEDDKLMPGVSSQDVSVNTNNGHEKLEIQDECHKSHSNKVKLCSREKVLNLDENLVQKLSENPDLFHGQTSRNNSCTSPKIKSEITSEMCSIRKTGSSSVANILSSSSQSPSIRNHGYQKYKSPQVKTISPKSALCTDWTGMKSPIIETHVRKVLMGSACNPLKYSPLMRKRSCNVNVEHKTHDSGVAAVEVVELRKKSEAEYSDLVNKKENVVVLDSEEFDSMPFAHESELADLYMEDVEMVPSYNIVSDSDKPISKIKHGEMINSEVISPNKCHTSVDLENDRKISGMASVDDVDMPVNHSPYSSGKKIKQDINMDLSSSSSEFNLDSSDDEKESPRKKSMIEISKFNQIKENSIYLNIAKRDMTKFINDRKDCKTVLNISDGNRVQCLPEQVQFIVNNEDPNIYSTIIDSSPLSVDDEDMSERVILESDLEVSEHDDLMENTNFKAETSLKLDSNDACEEVDDDSEEVVIRKKVNRAIISDSSSDDEENSRHMNMTSTSAFSSQSENLTTQGRVQLENDLAKMEREMQALKEQLRHCVPKPRDQVHKTVAEKINKALIETDDESDTESKDDLFLSQPTMTLPDSQEHDVTCIKVRDNETEKNVPPTVRADLLSETMGLNPSLTEYQTIPDSEPSQCSRQTHFDMKNQSGKAPSPAQKRSLGIVSEGAPLPVQKRALGIVTTGLTFSQIQVTKKLVATNGVKFFTQFNEAVTHVVVKPVDDDDLLCDRTLKFFQGIAHKCWIVNYFWVVDSQEVGYLLHEGPYEIQGDTANGEAHLGPKRSRLSKDKIFSDFEFSLIGDNAYLPKETMTELIQTCGGNVLDLAQLGQSHQKLTSLIVCCTDTEEEDGSEAKKKIVSEARALYKKYQVVTVGREWVLDSLTLYKLQNLNTYLITDVKNIKVPRI